MINSQVFQYAFNYNPASSITPGAQTVLSFREYPQHSNKLHGIIL